MRFLFALTTAVAVAMATGGVAEAGKGRSSNRDSNGAVGFHHRQGESCGDQKAGVCRGELFAALAKPKKKAIVDTAAGAGSFKTLVAAIKAAGLVDTLKGKGPFTVFAPTDAAFGKLPKGTLASLLKPENKKKLQGILTYHVVAGKVRAKDVVKLKTAKTVNGKSVKIKVKKGKVYVDGAQVVMTDIKCANGIIHVINKVILP